MIIEINNVKINYAKYGTGQPIILLHGNGEDMHIFNEIIPLLAQSYTVYSIDARGHGKSSKVKELHYTDMAQDIYYFIHTLKLDQPILYGFSDGGIVGLLLAIQYPKLLSTLIISGPNTSPDGVKLQWRILMKISYFITRSIRIKLMLKEPSISNEMLKQITIPTFITSGSNDVIKQSHIQSIHKHIPHSQLKIFNNETHSSYIVNSPKIGEYLLSILTNK